MSELATTASAQTNPLLSFTDLPPFSAIQPEHIKPAVEQAIATAQAAVEREWRP
ncbi:oligopeptidase A [Alishewanella longhuensis]